MEFPGVKHCDIIQNADSRSILCENVSIDHAKSLCKLVLKKWSLL